MKKKTENELLIGGGILAAGILVYEFFIKKPVTTTPTGTTIVPGSPGDHTHDPVSTYAQAVAENPNTLNSNYVMTDAEAQQLLNNYLDLRQGLVTGGWNKNILQAARDWWKLHGVAEKRVFVPLLVPSTAPYVPAPSNSNSSGSSSWVGSALSIAGTILAFFGVDDNKLNDTEIEILFTSAAIAKDILPLYHTTLSKQIDTKLNAVIEQYV